MKRATRSPFVRLVRLAGAFKGWVALSVLMGFATIASSIGLLAASAYIISAAALHPSIAELEVAIVAVRAFGIGRGVFRYLERYLSHQVTFRLLARLRVTFYQALEPLAPARLMRYRSGDLLSRILDDIGSLENFYVRALAPPAVAVLVALAAGIYLSSFHPALGGVLLGFLLAAGIGLPLLTRALARRPARRAVERRAAINASLVEGISGLADLLASNREGRFLEQVEALSQELGEAQMKLARVNSLQTALTSLLANLGTWAVLAAAIPLVTAGQIPGVTLAVLALAAMASFEAVQPLPQAALHLESSLEAARRLFSIVDARPEVQDPAEPAALPETFELEVRQVSFCYPALEAPPGGQSADEAAGEAQASLPALQEVSFDLPKGKHLAIVGPSGAGKSTLVNLLLRFWEIQQGEIRIGGQDIRRLQPEALRRAMAVVSQSTYLFSASVRENLLIARPKVSEAELVQAAQRAQIHDFIQGLPEGYDTWIGDQGLRLSGGERQRLAIARALLKDPALLILDEATANLDALTEQAVQAAIERLMAGRTTLTITHRLAGLERMDEILVLQGGKVVERGRHDELVARRGSYYKMWELQNNLLSSVG